MAHYGYGIDLGHMFAIGLKEDGTVVTAGSNESGQRNVSGWSDIVQVAAGWNFSLGLTSDGHVKFAGKDSKVSSSAISGWHDIEFIAANASAAAAIDRNGNLFVSGGPDEDSGTYSVPADLYSSGRPVSVSVGVRHILVLFDTGKVRAITVNNANYDGCCDVGGWTDIVQVAAGDNGSAALTADGRVLYTGSTSLDRNFGTITDVVSISAKGAHVVYIREDGTVGAVGWNKFGQSDVASYNNSGKQIVAVSTSGWNTLLLFDDGTAVSIGNDTNVPSKDVKKWTSIVRAK